MESFNEAIAKISVLDPLLQITSLKTFILALSQVIFWSKALTNIFYIRSHIIN